MIVITISNVPNSLRGDLTKWCQEIQTGVYVGRFNARIRDLLWQRIVKNIGSGEATMVFNTNNELGYDFRTTSLTKEVVDFDGVPLLRYLNVKPETTSKRGFSKAAHFHEMKLRQHIKLIPNCVSIDIETTGIDSFKDEIVSIGAVKIEKGKRSKFYKLIKINGKIPENISRLINITTKDCQQNGDSISNALSELLNYIGNLPLIGYNLNFDLNFILVALKKSQLAMLKNNSIDIMNIVKKHNKFLENYKLETVLKHYDVINQKPHNSLFDAEATLNLAVKLINLGYFKI